MAAQTVELLTPPDELYGLQGGELVLHSVPFYETADRAGLALQVGLMPDERDAALKSDLQVLVTTAGRRAIEFTRTDHQPFGIEVSDDNKYRSPVLDVSAAGLRFEENSKGLWWNVNTSENTEFGVLDAVGLNYTLHILTMYTARTQAKQVPRTSLLPGQRR